MSIPHINDENLLALDHFPNHASFFFLRSTLLLEQMATDPNGGLQSNVIRARREPDRLEHDLDPNLTLTHQQEAMDALSDMYSLLKEEDMWAGLWQKKAR